jgi:hypothetical protein
MRREESDEVTDRWQSAAFVHQIIYQESDEAKRLRGEVSSATGPDTSFSNNSLVSFWKTHNEVMSIGLLCYFNNLLVSNVGHIAIRVACQLRILMG